MLENELANTTYGDLSISQLFLKIENICSKILALDSDGKILDPRIWQYIVRGLLREYTPFITSIQGCTNQPSLVEFENLLVSQESLAK